MALSSTPSHAPSSTAATFPVALGGENFVDRRSPQGSSISGERRQFGSSHAGLSAAGRELALAIDEYKVQHHRRYITCDEMLGVLSELGYEKIR
jgi:hypothetical protein